MFQPLLNPGVPGEPVMCSPLALGWERGQGERVAMVAPPRPGMERGGRGESLQG
jgi:hypothetical protein